MKPNAFTTSLLLTIGYFSLSVFLFSSNLVDNTFLLLPVLILFGVGYGGGDSAMLLAGLFTFFMCWLILFVVTAIIYKIISVSRRK